MRTPTEHPFFARAQPTARLARLLDRGSSLDEDGSRAHPDQGVVTVADHSAQFDATGGDRDLLATPPVDGPTLELLDKVLYVPNCAGDRDEFPHSERGALVHGFYPDGALGLTVFHQHSVAMVDHVPYDPDGAPGTWRHRPARRCTCEAS